MVTSQASHFPHLSIIFYPLLAGSLLAQNDGRSLFGNKQDGQSDEGTRNLGEDRGIDDTEALGTTDLEVTVKDSHRIIVRSDRVGATNSAWGLATLN